MPEKEGLSPDEHGLLNDPKSPPKKLAKIRNEHKGDRVAQSEIDYYDPNSELSKLTLAYRDALKNNNYDLAGEIEKKLKPLIIENKTCSDVLSRN